MDELPIHVLLVEDNALDAHLVRSVLTGGEETGIALQHVDHLEIALSCLEERRFDLVLLDLLLPDARGVEAVRQVLATAPDVPIVVLSGHADKSIALQAVREGAQDYLIKGQIESDVLLRAIRYAIERHRLMREVRVLSLRDELTGLHNRRGFFELAEQHLKLSARTGGHNALIFVDLDGMKRINDEFGHSEGDRALCDVAKLLRGSFRYTDIVARLGGDEFVALLLHVDEARTGMAVQRLFSSLELVNAAPERAYPLSLSIGVVHCAPGEAATLDKLLLRADTAMYEQKRTRKAARQGVAV